MAAKETWGKCEMGTGIDDSGFSPRVILCSAPAKLRKISGFMFEVFVCDACDAKRKKD